MYNDSFNPRAREGATSATCDDSIRWKRVSIHAPVRARLGTQENIDVEFCFNPRAREGATKLDGRSGYRAPSFNPRAREGATCRAGRLFLGLGKFQSTRP